MCRIPSDRLVFGLNANSEGCDQMKRSNGAFVAAFLLLWNTGIRAETAPPQQGLVVVDSANTMAETEARLVGALDRAGLKVAAKIDHQANAKSVGLDLAPTVLFIFGNPKAGTGLIELERTVGIDQPLKILLWDDKGKVKIAYNDPAYIARRHGLDASLPVLTQIAAALQRFAAAAANK
ncbi:MAG: DUF302 domain-containing protein [Bradyrhizobium sp.]